MTILIYNNDKNEIEKFDRKLDDTMPYIIGNSLTVREFRGSSSSSILWTDKKTIDAWNQFRKIWGKPIYVGYAFKRIWEKGHSGQSQHYAGTAFDVGQTATVATQDLMRTTAINSGLWSYVEPSFLTPNWVHFDKRSGPPACYFGGYPLVKQGNKSNYVMILQDSLITLGYLSGTIDGVFGPKTRAALISFQKSNGLFADGICGCDSWKKITSTIFNAS